MSRVLTQEGQTFSAVEYFEIITCYKCGIPFGVPDHWKANRLSDQESFYCPNGHCQSYNKSTEKVLREKLEKSERQRLEERYKALAARQQRDSVRKSHRKMRDRVKNGVCPCCNRTFQNLLKHMQTKHPEMGDDKTLRQIRETYGMTQSGLSEEIGVSQAQISAFENGRSVTVWARDQIESWIDEQGNEH